MGQRYKSVDKTSWPSGLRRNVKAVVFIGVDSNPTDVTLFTVIYYKHPHSVPLLMMQLSTWLKEATSGHLQITPYLMEMRHGNIIPLILSI